MSVKQGYEVLAEKMLGYFGEIRKTTKKTILKDVLENLAHAQLDLDKAGDLEDAAYYTGLADAYFAVATMLAPVIDKRKLYPLLDFKIDDVA